MQVGRGGSAGDGGLPSATGGYRRDMEIVIVVLLVVIAAGLVFAWTKRPDTTTAGAGGLRRRGKGVRGRHRAAAASRHDPMADAVERHAMATDPHEAAEAELRLQAQANRVAADLHVRQAATLESEAGGVGGQGRSVPATAYDQPAYDAAGRPVHQDQPIHADGRALDADDRPDYHDENGRAVYPEDRPKY